MLEINRGSRQSRAWVHFVTDRASLLTDHRMSGRPIRAKCKHFKTIWEQTSDNSPLFSNSSFLIWWSSKQGWETLYGCSVFLFANSQHRSTHFRACPSTSWDHAEVFARSLSHPVNCSVAPAEIRDSNILLYCPKKNFSFGLHSRCVHSE